jgi:hypothetical protein
MLNTVSILTITDTELFLKNELFAGEILMVILNLSVISDMPVLMKAYK